MREIKFRAWVPKVKRMGRVSELNFMTNTLAVATNPVFNEIFRLKQVRLMQYTGLKDMNGVEIYEGDIVKAYRTCQSDLITFDNGSFGIALDDWHSFESFTDFYGKCEVIGNKFENPELLGAGL